jgi:hypothetical protein
MKPTLAVVSALLATAITAAPVTTTVTVQLANDFTGANADVPIIANGSPNAIATLFAGTSIDNDGQILATSAQLTQFVTGTSCVIEAGATVIGTLNTDQMFADLDATPNVDVPIDVTGDVIICEV